ncbi:uncharacterized protein LOC114827995 [Galendromus occidentalis]|uniref:Uncharacterized protein LOC114827995 n=1 Tax=Galendromus occidentalis TaxID=34638 RepID=A0AAJ7SEI1_9ACAR|nr:uncharacterized protein LOC114827995 [Galendromus occidentalis]
MDLSASDGNWAVEDVPLVGRDMAGTQCPVATSDQSESDPENDLMSIEAIGEDLQTKVLELKGALHKSEPHVNVRFLMETQGDVLACVANDLSTLPTNQICLLLKSFLAEKSNRMLQCDLAVLFRHLVFAHLGQPHATVGATILSYGAELASRWSRLFVENILLPSLKNLGGTLETFVKKSLKAIDGRESLGALSLLLKSLAEEIENIPSEKMDRVLSLAEVLVVNCEDFNGEIFSRLSKVFHTHEGMLVKNRVFAKILLDIVKRTKHLEAHVALVGEILSGMTHPMRNIIQKLIDTKGSHEN